MWNGGSNPIGKNSWLHASHKLQKKEKAHCPTGEICALPHHSWVIFGIHDPRHEIQGLGMFIYCVKKNVPPGPCNCTTFPWRTPITKGKKNILQWFLSTVSYAFQFSQQRSFGTIKANIDSAFLQGQQTTALNFDKHGHYEQAFGSISVLKKLKHTAATISIKLFTMINIQWWQQKY